MRRFLPALTLALLWAGSAQAHGVLMPDDKDVPPLAMLNHKVTITIEDQVAVTKVEQTFRNGTQSQLEGTYVFPVPNGAAVNRFSMVVNGKVVKADMVEAGKAKDIYANLVRRTQNAGLLEYMGHGLFQVRVPAIAPNSDQKIVLSYTSVAPREGETVEYTYPLRAESAVARTLEDFSITATIKSQHAVQNVYSPTHAIDIKRKNDREASITFDRNQGLLDKDFQLFYSLGKKDVGLTMLTQRPAGADKGYFLMLVSPNVEMPKDYEQPRDVILVLDTSTSMKGAKIEQAKKAMKYCLGNLGAKDRFALVRFSADVTKYQDKFEDVNKDSIAKGQKWVDDLQLVSGTNINDGLTTALDMRTDDMSRTFTVIFFTDGMPSKSETNPEKILKNVQAKNSANTRIFSFGVGDDVNASFLDRLAEQTRGFSTYVRNNEDIEAKVSRMYDKINTPVLANLKLTVSGDVQLEEIYPQELPDLFLGSQLVVLGRYRNHGQATVKLTGSVGKDAKEFTHKVAFAENTTADREFVEQLWARRKVGYLLDQIRVNGEKKEMVDEVIELARKYGITTPYTSYLIVPDMPVAFGAGKGGQNRQQGPEALAPQAPGAAPTKVSDFLRQTQQKPGELAENRGRFEDGRYNRAPAAGDMDEQTRKAIADAKNEKDAYEKAKEALAKRDQNSVQNGKLGVDLSLQTKNLRNQARVAQSAIKKVGGRTVLEIGGVWIDEGYDGKTPTVTVKAMSDAYFRILERQSRMREVFRLGNHLVWVTPSGTALIIDTTEGKERMTDDEIDRLFVKK